MSANPNNNSRLTTIFLTFFKIGMFTFGGGFAMIPLMQKEIVERYQWLTAEDFLDTIAVTQAAPGPVAVNSAVFIGYRLAGFWGSVCALLGTVLPSFLIILLVAIFLTNIGHNALLQRFFQGVRPAIVALILSAGLRMGKKSLRESSDYLIALIALLLLLIFNLHPIILIVLGAIWGVGKIHYLLKRRGGNK